MNGKNLPNGITKCSECGCSDNDKEWEKKGSESQVTQYREPGNFPVAAAVNLKVTGSAVSAALKHFCDVSYQAGLMGFSSLTSFYLELGAVEFQNVSYK